MYHRRTTAAACFTAIALLTACTGLPKEVEVGPYTVSSIEKNVYHIQDYNKSNPAGDAFGSTNLLLFSGPFSTLINTCTRTADYMQKNGIDKLYPGHYHGDNPETLQRVLDELKMSREVLSGKRKGNPNNTNGLNREIFDYGVHIRYNVPDALR